MFNLKKSKKSKKVNACMLKYSKEPKGHDDTIPPDMSVKINFVLSCIYCICHLLQHLNILTFICHNNNKFGSILNLNNYDDDDDIKKT